MRVSEHGHTAVSIEQIKKVVLPRSKERKREKVAGKLSDSKPDKASVADEFERRQNDEIIRALVACKGRVGGPDGAAALLGLNRATLYSQMRKYGIYAKQYAYPPASSA